MLKCVTLSKLYSHYFFENIFVGSIKRVCVVKLHVKQLVHGVLTVWGGGGGGTD